MTAAPHRVLVVGPSWVGDMVMSQALYKLLKKRIDADIDVLAPAASVSLVARMAEVSRGIRLDTGHGELKLNYRWNLATRLRDNHYDQAIVLPNSLKSSLIPFLAGIQTRTGFRGEFRYYLLNDMRLLDERRLPRMVDRFVALGLPDGAPLPDAIDYPSLMVDTENRDRLCDALSLSVDRPVLGVCPGAEYGDAKKWPEEHYAALIDFAVSQGMQAWIFGSPADAGTAAKIVAALTDRGRSHTVDLTGETRLTDAIDLLSRCNLVVSNDSGLMHVAAAVGCPVAVIYGSTSPGFTPPLSDRVEIVTDDLPCSPCFQRTCPLRHKDCLYRLMPDRLEASVRRWGIRDP
ncbi:MAG: lipopolysaccharide heptosyltransferase II [Pseudomonadales bacterium]|nr:lipopolysaccharide heptosyltransferase II [Pseudomonadales bacterium]